MDDIDWDFWRSLDHLYMWQAALLTLGLNPEGLEYSFNPTHLFDQDSMRIRIDSSFDWKNHNETAFKKRHWIINSNRDVGQYAFGTHEINLKSFIEWALKSNTFEIPEPLLTGNSNLKPKQQLYSKEEWHSLAQEYAVKELENNPKILQDDVCKVIYEKFKRDNILSTREKIPVVSSIKKCLSDWGFATRRSRLQNR